jgi:hypothetical protein
MIIDYTEHAASRMRHRKITKREVEETVSRSESVFASRFGRQVALKKYGEKYLKVICEKSNDKITVITVYWTRRP